VNVLYEENGEFKIGAVLSDSETSLQVEALHGKRVKIKAANVLLRFPEPATVAFLEQARAAAADIDTDFLWEASGSKEFGFADLAREYYGRAPAAVEATTILLKLHSAPIHFHRKGRGRFAAAPPEILKAALASAERKRQQQAQIDEWVVALERGEMPDALRPMLSELLYEKADRNRPEAKAFSTACEKTGLTPARLVERCGALPSSHDFHRGRFLHEFFPRGTIFHEKHEPQLPADLPLAEVRAFSLDDASTTEIDDAFSLTPLPDGLMRVGIHIAAPALGFAPGSSLDAIARERLSTVYMPGDKITMLPPEVVERFSLDAGDARPALSFYADVDPATGAIRATASQIERVPVAENLRHQDVDALNDAFAADHAVEGIAFAGELRQLFRFAQQLEAGRGRANQTVDRLEYAFRVENDRVTIEPRKRGAPLDKLVAELMILVNRSWGRLLADAGVAAIYRTQPAAGKVRMTTDAGEHAGLGVSHYAWSSSPLRRYVDLVNQWQLIAALANRTAPFARNSAELLAAMRDFEITYAAYGEFQDRMERYWCLRWLLQEEVRQARAEVVREGTVRLADIPLYVRVPSLPALAPGAEVVIEIGEVDLIDSEVRCVYKNPRSEGA